MMVSIVELTEKFGPTLNVPPFGECIVIQGPEFDPDWEAELGDLGFNCHFGSLDNHAVTFVQLKKSVAPGKVVYVPPPKPVVLPEVKSNEKEVKETEKIAERKKYSLKGPSWIPEVEVELLKEYDRLVSEGLKYGSYKVLVKLPRFKDRSSNAIRQKLKRLIRKRRKNASSAAVQVKEEDSLEVNEVESKENSEIMWTAEEDAFLAELWKQVPKLTSRVIAQKFVERFPKRRASAVPSRICVLQVKGVISPRWKLKRKDGENNAAALKGIEATESEKSTSAPEPEVKVDFELALANLTFETKREIDQLTKALSDLKTEFERQKNFVLDIYVRMSKNNNTIETLEPALRKHKHAVSGEAMLPMEAQQ